MIVLQPDTQINADFPSRVPIIPPLTFEDIVFPSVFPTINYGAFTFDVLVIDESRRKETTLTDQSGFYSNDSASFTIDYEIEEGIYYFLIIYQGTRELAKVKIFCTTQTDLQDYSITEGEFTEAPASSNDFIIID